jgi:hypothetical protein
MPSSTSITVEAFDLVEPVELVLGGVRFAGRGLRLLRRVGADLGGVFVAFLRGLAGQLTGVRGQGVGCYQEADASRDAGDMFHADLPVAVRPGGWLASALAEGY